MDDEDLEEESLDELIRQVRKVNIHNKRDVFYNLVILLYFVLPPKQLTC
jgi:hypothetical protein